MVQFALHCPRKATGAKTPCDAATVADVTSLRMMHSFEDDTTPIHMKSDERLKRMRFSRGVELVLLALVPTALANLGLGNDDIHLQPRAVLTGAAERLVEQ